MAVKSKYFDPKTYYYKVLVLCGLLVIDILFNSFTQFITFGVKDDSTNCHKDDVYLSVGISFLQLILIVVMIFVLLNIFSETYYFKRGYLGIVCKDFIISFIFLLLYPIFFIVERAVFGKKLNIYYQNEKNNNSNEERALIKIWHSAYLILYIIKFIVAFGFYIGILRTSFELGKSNYYISGQIK